MDVIPFILSEEVAKEIPIDFIVKLADCSSSVVKDRVKKYIATDGADGEVVEIVKAAYLSQLEMEEFLNDEKLKEYVEIVHDLDYVDINPHKSIEMLEKYKVAITYVLDNKYSVPYIAPISGTLIKDLRDEISNYADGVDSPTIKLFAKRLKSCSGLFRDSQHTAYRGTVVKKVIRNRSKYEVILRGIDFMLDKKRTSKNPSSWRYL